MTSKDTFGVVVRVVGLLVVLAAILYFLSGIVLIINPQFRPNVEPSWHYFLDGAIGLLIGLYLLRGAPHVVRFAYRDEDSEADKKPDS